jgi:O-antigen/teichoic acid export membrane protein
LLGFGGYMTASRFAWFFMSQADVLLGSKFLGKEALGLYSVSLHLASLPMQKTMGIINQVAFSAISRTQDQAAVARAGIAKAIRLLAHAILPVLVGLACVAPDFIPVVLGANWGGAVLPLQLVALAVPLRMLSAILSTAVSALGRADVDFRNTLTGVVVMPLCFLAGMQWGAVGLAASWIVGVPVVYALNNQRTRSVLGLSMGDILAVIARPALATLLMAAALLGLRHVLKDTAGAPSILAALIVAGTVVYSAAAWVFDAEFRQEVLSFAWVRRLRARPRRSL